MLNRNQQLKIHSAEPQQNENKENENKGTQHKIAQLKVHTGIRIGDCWWDYNCQKYWC
jgi:hypothetical protein